LVQTGHAGKDESYKVEPDFIAEDLNGAVHLIMQEIKYDC
jgi:hypothetical protein